MTLRHWDYLVTRTEEAVGDVDRISDAAGKIVVRDANSDAALRRMNASQHVEVGTTAGGKVRVQTTAPTAPGHLQIDPVTGEALLYVTGFGRVKVRTGFEFQWSKELDDTAPGNELFELPIGRAPGYLWTIVDAYYLPRDGLSAHATDFARLTIGLKHEDDGSDNGIPAIGDTKPSGANATGSWVAHQKVQLTLDPMLAYPILAGAYPVFSILKPAPGTGVIVPGGRIVVIGVPWQG